MILIPLRQVFQVLLIKTLKLEKKPTLSPPSTNYCNCTLRVK